MAEPVARPPQARPTEHGAEELQVASETGVYPARHGVDVNAAQDTRTSTSLRVLAARLPEVGTPPEVSLVSG